MPAPDRRSVGELLADCDLLAREVLADPTPDQAAGLLRGWAPIVHEAARLWGVMPSVAPTQQQTDPVLRLSGIAAGISRGTARAEWPGHGPTDARLAEIHLNMRRARLLVERYGRDIQPTSEEVRTDIGAAQARIMHTLYVLTHGTAVSVRGQVAEVEWSTRHSRARGTLPLPVSLAAGRRMLDRLEVFEQVAGVYVAAHPVTLAALGEVRPDRPPTRLSAALTAWDLRVHHTLTGKQVDMPDLVRVARVQALIATSAVVVGQAAAQVGAVSADAADRLSFHGAAAETAWTHIAQRAGQLVGIDGTTDPGIVRAAAQARAAIRTTACTPTGWATPQQLSQRINVARTLQTLQQALAAAVDVAHLAADVALEPGRLTAPARLIEQQVWQSLIAPDPGRPPIDCAEKPVTRQQMNSNERIPLTPSICQDLEYLARAAADNSRRTAALPLDQDARSSRPRAARGARTPHPPRPTTPRIELLARPTGTPAR